MLRALHFLRVAAAIVLIPACGGSGGGTSSASNGSGQGNVGPDFSGLTSPDVAYLADSNIDGMREVFVADRLGITIRNISGTIVDGGSVRRLFWSPDRAWIAFTAEKRAAGVLELFVASSVGGPARLLNKPLGPGQAVREFVQWSPDSSRVLYAANQDDPSREELFVSTADGTSVGLKLSATPLIAASSLSFLLRWSPDGLRVAYAAEHEAAGREDLFVVDRDGSGRVKVSHDVAGAREFGQARWSPDGLRIAYVCNNPGVTNHELWTTMTDGTQRNLIGPIVSNDSVAWHPGSTSLAYAANTPELFICQPDGSGAISRDSGFGARELTWSPDGAWLAYNDAGPDSVYVLPALTGAPVTVSDSVRLITFFQWTSDSARVVYVGRLNISDPSELFASAPDTVGATAVSGSMAGSGVSIPEISPDGQRVAYSGQELSSPATEVFAANRDGSQRIRLCPALPAGRHASLVGWTADGARILYISDQDADERYELWSSLPDGTGNLRVSGPLPAFADLLFGSTR